MTLLATWGCASEFLKMLPKFNMAARSQLQKKNCGRKNTIWRCAGDFFKVLLKFKMAATDQLQFLVITKTQKLVWLIFFKFQHHIPSKEYWQIIKKNIGKLLMEQIKKRPHKNDLLMF